MSDPFATLRTGFCTSEANSGSFDRSSRYRICISFPDLPTLQAAHGELIAAIAAPVAAPVQMKRG